MWASPELIATVVGATITVIISLAAYIKALLNTKTLEQERRKEEIMRTLRQQNEILAKSVQLAEKSADLTEKIHQSTNGTAKEALVQATQRGYIAGQISERLSSSRPDDDELERLKNSFAPQPPKKEQT